jgi:hypothetical protein
MNDNAKSLEFVGASPLVTALGFNPTVDVGMLPGTGDARGYVLGHEVFVNPMVPLGRKCANYH